MASTLSALATAAADVVAVVAADVVAVVVVAAAQI